MDIAEESAETAINSPDQTPTEIKKTKAEQIHTTTSTDGARFVAGHVLAGRYRIIGLIGKGGMGEVYKAEDLELEQTIALKFLPEKLAKEEDLLKRFRSEGTLAEHDDIPIRIEAASFEGRPVLFRIIPPWDEERPVSPTVAAFDAAKLYPGMGSLLIAAFGGLFFSFKNVKARRVDRVGVK